MMRPASSAECDSLDCNICRSLVFAAIVSRSSSVAAISIGFCRRRRRRLRAGWLVLPLLLRYSSHHRWWWVAIYCEGFAMNNNNNNILCSEVAAAAAFIGRRSRSFCALRCNSMGNLAGRSVGWLNLCKAAVSVTVCIT